MKYLLLILFLASSNISLAQEGYNFGFGANAGYKSLSGEAGFAIEFKYKKIFDLFGGLASTKFNGLGYFIGSTVFFSQNSLQPCIGFAYNYQSGSSFYVGETIANRSDYRVNPNDNFISIIGIRKLIQFDDKNDNGFMSFTPYLSYRYTRSPYKVLNTGGIVDHNQETKINNRIGSGLGVGLKVIYFLN